MRVGGTDGDDLNRASSSLLGKEGQQSVLDQDQATASRVVGGLREAKYENIFFC